MRGARLLIVEDEIILAKSLEMYLSDLGYEICGLVANGQKSLKIVEDKKPDIVLMDINLYGEIDGIEAAKRIKTLFSIPIVFMTGYEDEETMERANCVEHSGYLIKPVEPEDLQSVINGALQR
jgi:CheY-like chemotaxis protein